MGTISIILCSVLLAQSTGDAGRNAGHGGGALTIEVVDREARGPLADARLSFRHDFLDGELPIDDQGRGGILLPEEPITFLEVLAAAPGFVPLQQVWQQTAGELALPERFSFVLERGRPGGGRVVDGDGRPVAGAEVRVNAFSAGMPRVYIRDHLVRTDADGHWRCDVTPPGRVIAKDLRGPAIQDAVLGALGDAPPGH